MKNGQKWFLTRRKFIIYTATTGSALAIGSGASRHLSSQIKRLLAPGPDFSKIKIRWTEPNSKLGHQTWQDKPVPPEPDQSNSAEHAKFFDVAIIGGGISGLAAARALSRETFGEDSHARQVRVALFELESELGGNSRSGSHPSTRYPLGAHYLPILNEKTCVHTRQFLKEEGLLVENPGEPPSYDETALCSEPFERLFLFGKWQDGLVPNFGISLQEKQEITRFFELIKNLRVKKGTDGRFAFDLPACESSLDEEFTRLDKITMAEYLSAEKFSSNALIWYLNYCYRDDFGAGVEEISAWAGFHYFCSRRGVAKNAESHSVLTWPEGNANLVYRIRQQLTRTTQMNAVVTLVRFDEFKKVFKFQSTSAQTQSIEHIEAKHIIWAAPAHVARHVLEPRFLKHPIFQPGQIKHFPWVTANIVIKDLDPATANSLTWDNVGYQSPVLGYIVANHQLAQQTHSHHVFTFYRPIDEADPAVTRTQMKDLATFKRQLELEVFSEAERLHPGLSSKMVEAHFHFWPHAMICPTIGIQNMARALGGRVHTIGHGEKMAGSISWAHADFSGISLFEEGFEWGSQLGTQLSKVIKKSVGVSNV